MTTTISNCDEVTAVSAVDAVASNNFSLCATILNLPNVDNESIATYAVCSSGRYICIRAETLHVTSIRIHRAKLHILPDVDVLFFSRAHVRSSRLLSGVRDAQVFLSEGQEGIGRGKECEC